MLISGKRLSSVSLFQQHNVVITYCQYLATVLSHSAEKDVYKILVQYENCAKRRRFNN